MAIREVYTDLSPPTVLVSSQCWDPLSADNLACPCWSLGNAQHHPEVGGPVPIPSLLQLHVPGAPTHATGMVSPGQRQDPAALASPAQPGPGHSPG